MAYNLFVAYDLVDPGQNYEAVISKIKSLGQWYKAQYSLFYLHSNASADTVSAALRTIMDVNDKLCVIDASRAVMTPLSDKTVAEINTVWHS